MKSNEDKVQVLIRFRPLIKTELIINPLSCVDLTDTEVTLYSCNSNTLIFSFDKVLNSMSSQSETFSSGPEQIVESVMNGFNGTIFTYGQIASGKTYTMFGESRDNERLGMIPRAIKKIFDFIENSDENDEFLIKFSFFELINEKIRDLLNPLGENLKLKYGKNGVFISGIREVYTRNEVDISDLIAIGFENRDKVKIQQPRHTFVTLALQRNSSDGLVDSKLYMVDLAGVERTGSLPTSPRSATMKSINQSLSSLAMVISALSDKSSTFVPYRTSKLTRILEDSLGGNSKTLAIITCSPSPANAEDTASSLRFGMRIKSVSNTPVVNKNLSMHELNIQYLQKLETLQKVNKQLGLLQFQKTRMFSERCSLVEVESPKPQIDLTEMRLELEEIYSRINTQEQVFRDLNEEVAGNKEKFDLLEGVDKKTTELLRQITENDEVLDEELREHEEEAEVLALAVDKLKAEVEREDEELERRKELLDRAEAENETLKVKVRCLKEMRSSLSKAALEEQLRRRIKEEKVNNKKLKEDMKQIQEEIDLLLFKRFKEYAIAEDLQRSAKKIFDLELSLDNTRISYLEDQQKLTPTQKSLKNKQDALEKLADRVSKDFRSVTSKFAEMNIERSVLQKKVKRLEDLSLKLEEDLRKIDKKLSKVEKFNQISSTNPTKLLRSGSVRASLTLRQLKLSVESEFPD